MNYIINIAIIAAFLVLLWVIAGLIASVFDDGKYEEEYKDE